MYRYIPIKLKCKVEELPPAFEASIPSNEICEQTKKEDFINIFYVGGVNPQLYNLEKNVFCNKQ